MRDAYLSLPLRVGADGCVARGSPEDALVGLFRVMAATSPTAWPHAPWFGLRDAFAEANMWLEDQQPIADALNRALAGLGVGWARVESVTSATDQPVGERHFRLTLVFRDTGKAVHTRLGV